MTSSSSAGEGPPRPRSRSREKEAGTGEGTNWEYYVPLWRPGDEVGVRVFHPLSKEWIDVEGVVNSLKWEAETSQWLVLVEVDRQGVPFRQYHHEMQVMWLRDFRKLAPPAQMSDSAARPRGWA